MRKSSNILAVVLAVLLAANLAISCALLSICRDLSNQLQPPEAGTPSSPENEPQLTEDEDALRQKIAELQSENAALNAEIAERKRKADANAHLEAAQAQRKSDTSGTAE